MDDHDTFDDGMAGGGLSEDDLWDDEDGDIENRDADVLMSAAIAASPDAVSEADASSSNDVLAFDPVADPIGHKRSEASFWRLLKDTWSRERPSPDATQKNVAFFVNDCDYTIGRPPSAYPKIIAKMSRSSKVLSEVPIIQIFGITSEGHSVAVMVHGFFPYLYCECPQSHKDASVLKQKLEELLASSAGRKTDDQCVLEVEICKRQSLMHYSSAGPADFFKITTSHPRYVAASRRHIESSLNLSPGAMDRRAAVPPTAYEANIPFALRFMVDNAVQGCSWLEMAAGSYFEATAESRATTCQLELHVHFSDIVAHSPDGEWLKLPKLRILSFDIECVKLEGKGFPVPMTDPIIQIATIMTDQEQVNEPVFKTIMTLHSCSAIPGSTVLHFSDEREMLQRWQQLVLMSDPDFITGYNVVNFDLNYIIERSVALKLPAVRFLGRLRNVQSRVRDARLSSRALGTHDSKDIRIDGRVQLDMLVAIRRDYKLKSYSLNAVSAHFLQQQKEDVHYSMIGDLHRGSAETRRRIAVYCLKDAELPLRLLRKLMIIYNYVEMARVTGVPITYLLTRGQQVKVTSQLLRKCRASHFLLPSVKVQGSGEVAYEGAIVLEPKKGFYDDPIATLDFASLYPSIMMAYNLCYSTLVPVDKLNNVPSDHYVKTPSNAHFVKKEFRKGILPEIVEELISARKRAKKEMANATDPFVKAVLNGRQLALKISANSVYGYTGATAGGQLPCLDISTSITAYGRQMIDITKDEVEKQFKIEKGYAYDAEVVYGDTDSVMVKFGNSSIEDSMNLGKEAADFISKQFPHPIKLEFEKVFCPFLLMNKKRYAGLLYTKPDAHDSMDCKGIETVRRDFCLLIQQVVDQSLKKILIGRDVEGAKAYVKGVINDLLQNDIDMSLLVMSKSIGKDDYAGKLAHVELAKKMKARDPATAPQVGDRVHYVVIRGSKKQPQYDRAEDPLHVLEHNLSIDSEHYLDALKKPVARIFEAVMDDPDQLFTGSHTMTRKNTMPTSGMMAGFFTTSLRCLGCRAVIKDGGLCARCVETKQRDIVLTKVQSLRDKQREFSELWTQCQRCQGSLLQDVICTSRDCPIFYRRMKVKKEIDEHQDHVNRLNVDW